jgi:hypothetical protein
MCVLRWVAQPRAAPPVSRVASKAAVDEEVARPASGGAAAASRRDGPMGIAWDLQFLKSLNAALRVGSWLFAIITFAAMDDSVLGGKFSRFKFVLAVVGWRSRLCGLYQRAASGAAS